MHQSEPSAKAQKLQLHVSGPLTVEQNIYDMLMGSFLAVKKRLRKAQLAMSAATAIAAQERTRYTTLTFSHMLLQQT